MAPGAVQHIRRFQFLLKLDLSPRCGIKTLAASFHQANGAAAGPQHHGLYYQQRQHYHHQHYHRAEPALFGFARATHHQHQQQQRPLCRTVKGYSTVSGGSTKQQSSSGVNNNSGPTRANNRNANTTTSCINNNNNSSSIRRISSSAVSTSVAATSSNSSSSTGSSSISEEVSVRYARGLPHITVPLPSRNERCQFTLRPVTHTVGNFLEMLKLEDRGIDRAAILNRDGVRIAASCSIENLMEEEFWLHLNDRQYFVKPPKREKITSEELTRLGDVQALVAQLYETLNVGEHQIRKERELNAKLEALNEKLGPLEVKKNELDQRAARRTNMLTWVGLGLMSVQFGVLARLTWWEYSWDIMEPVTYFVTYGTAMAAYAYFVLTKQEYILPDVKDRQHLITLHKEAKKAGVNITEYNDIKRQIAEIEHDLRRLRDPLYLHLPAPPPKTPTYSATEIATSKKMLKEALEQSGTSLSKQAASKISSLLESTGNPFRSKK